MNQTDPFVRAVQAEEFVHNVFLAAGDPQFKAERPSTWHHILSWYPAYAAPNVLFLFYEDIVQVRRLSLSRLACVLTCNHSLSRSL